MICPSTPTAARSRSRCATARRRAASAMRRGQLGDRHVGVPVDLARRLARSPSRTLLAAAGRGSRCWRPCRRSAPRAVGAGLPGTYAGSPPSASRSRTSSADGTGPEDLGRGGRRRHVDNSRSAAARLAARRVGTGQRPDQVLPQGDGVRRRRVAPSARGVKRSTPLARTEQKAPRRSGPPISTTGAPGRRPGRRGSARAPRPSSNRTANTRPVEPPPGRGLAPGHPGRPHRASPPWSAECDGLPAGPRGRARAPRSPRRTPGTASRPRRRAHTTAPPRSPARTGPRSIVQSARTRERNRSLSSTSPCRSACCTAWARSSSGNHRAPAPLLVRQRTVETGDRCHDRPQRHRPPTRSSHRTSDENGQADDRGGANHRRPHHTSIHRQDRPVERGCERPGPPAPDPPPPRRRRTPRPARARSRREWAR